MLVPLLHSERKTLNQKHKLCIQITILLISELGIGALEAIGNMCHSNPMFHADFDITDSYAHWMLRVSSSKYPYRCLQCITTNVLLLLNVLPIYQIISIESSLKLN